MNQGFSFVKGTFYKHYVKRATDILGSLFLLILFSPVYLISAVFIWIDSPGPILADVPERVGEYGKKFKMFKFRSMIVNAHHLLRTDPKLKQLYEEYKKGSY